MTTLNEKGAFSYISTLYPLIDLFGVNTPDFKTLEFEEFQTIFNICHNAYVCNPTQYLSLLMYRRSTDFLGHKMVYYIMASIIRENHKKEYPHILEWSHGYKKDLLRMARIYSESDMSWESNIVLNMKELDNTKNKQTSSFIHRHSEKIENYNVPPELELYSKKIIEYLEGPEFNMCFKYIGTSHFNVENMIIKRTVNQLLEKDGKECYTNSQFRKLFSSQKKKLFLFDKFLQGYKEDGTRLKFGDENYVVSYMKKMSSTAFQNAKNTISEFSESSDEYKKVLYHSFCILLDQVSTKKFSVKSHGINNSLADSCYDAYTKNTFDPFLESSLNSKLEKMICENKNDIDIVIDHSGSMSGDPIKNALYITLFLYKLYNIESAVLFSDRAKRVYIQGDTWYEAIHSLYRYANADGRTNLESIFPYLENNSNTTLIITDGDCDPTNENTSPFRDALIRFPNRKFIVWNVKRSNLHFPYSINDNRVGYISGNEPSVIDAVFKNISEGTLNPISLLETCISVIDNPFVLESVKTPFTKEKIGKLFCAIKKNTPKDY